MSSLLRILAVLLGGLCLAAVIFAVLLHLVIRGVARDIGNRFSADETPAEIADLPRIHFLSGVDFDTGPIRLVLENSVTGTDALLIDDQALLRRMASDASIPNLGVGGRASLLAMIFTGGKMADRVPALRLYRGRELLSEEYCLPQQCSDAETIRSLQPLIAKAAGRVVSHHESFTDHAAYAAAFARAKAAPGLMTALPLRPAPVSMLPVSFSIPLPAISLPLAEPLTPETAADLSDYASTLEAVLAARLPGIDFYVSDVPQARGTTLHDGCDSNRPQLAVLDDTRIATVKAEGDTDAQGYARLAAITDWSFLPLRPAPPLPEALEQRISAGDLAPDCLRIWSPEGPALRPAIAVSPPQPVQYDLQWEEVLPLRDHDESAVLE